MPSALERGLSEPITGEAYRRMHPEDFIREACDTCMTPIEPILEFKTPEIVFQKQKEAQAADTGS